VSYRHGKFVNASKLTFSLLLLFLFLRSYYHGDYFTLTTSSRRSIIFSDCCSLRYQSVVSASARAGLEYDHVFNPFDYYIDFARTPTWSRVLGNVRVSKTSGFSLSIPYWPLALPAAWILGRSFWLSRKTYRRRVTIALLLALWPFFLPLVFDVAYEDVDIATCVKLSMFTFGLGWLLRSVPTVIKRTDAFVMIACFVNWRARRRRFRQTHGFCADCGFDLRASPYRCPECGAVATYWIGWALPVRYEQSVGPPLQK